MPAVQDRYAVFLSYNRRDKDVVEVLFHKLREAGMAPWFDEWAIIPGGRWIDALAEGIFASDSFAAFIGPHSQGDWESEEIDLAQIRAAKDPTFRIILVLLPGAPDPFDYNTCHPFLSTRSWVDFRKGPEDQHAFHLLKCGIKGIPPGSETDSSLTNDDQSQDTCPYRGLQVFDVNDAEFYFGRRGEIQRLVEKLKTTRFLGVLGPSGSGKSSLVRAGLIPALSSGDLPGSQTWKIVRPFSPGSAPLEALALRLAKLHDVDTSVLLGLLRKSEYALHTAVCGYLEEQSKARDGTQRVLFVVDQLEEVFTLCDKESDRSQFLVNLFYAGSVPSGGCVVVMTLRADFYYKCMAYPEFAAALSAQQFLINPMQNDSLVQAIERPAHRVNLMFEPRLIETIVGDVGNQPGSLPLLEHAMLELWKRRKHGQLTFEGYADSGKVQGAIAKRAEAIYESFGPAEQAVTQRIMQRLTELGEGTEDTRRRAEVSELSADSTERNSVEEVVEELVRSRLLTISSDLGDERTVDVAHEALIRGWPRLNGWIEEKRGALQIHHRLTEATREWRSQNRRPEFLYRGFRLAEAQELRSSHASLLNELEREFLEASNKADHLEKQTAHRRRLGAIAILVIGLILIGMFMLLFYQRYQERQALQSRLIAARAEQKLYEDPPLAIKLAIEAGHIYHTEEADSALRQALSRLEEVTVIRGHEDVVYTVDFSPDGNRIVTASLDQTARVWDAHDGHQIWKLTGHIGAVFSATFDSTGNRVVTAGADKTARVWDARDGRQLLELKGHTDEINSAAFSTDGKRVVTASLDGTARIWDLETGKKLILPYTVGTKVIFAAFSSNGSQVVTAGTDAVARIWDAYTGKQVALLSGHDSWVSTAVFSPDGSKVLTASKDQTVRLWDVQKQKELFKFQGHTNWAKSAMFSADGRYVVTASKDGTARVWDVSTQRQLSEFSGHSGWVNYAAFSPDSKKVATAGGDHTIRIRSVQTEQQSLELRDLGGPILNAAFNRDATRVATACFDNTARVWDVSTGEQLVLLSGHTNLVYGLAFSPDSRQVVTPSFDGTARIWDAQKEQPPSVLTGHIGGVMGAAFSADGKQLVTGGRDFMGRIWDLQTNQPPLELRGHIDSLFNAAFSPDATKVVTGSADQTARIWDAQTGKPLSQLRGHRNAVISVVFSPDGKKVFTASADGTARFWDVQTAQLLFELTGHNDKVVDVAFSPDEKHVVTASWDGTARIWDVYTGKPILKLFTQGSSVLAAVFTPDGKHIVTITEDKMIRTYACEVCGPIEDVRKLAIDRLARLASESPDR